MRDQGRFLLRRLNDERGMAFLTVMMVLLMLTVLGIAAITVTGVENNMAGLQRTMEASANAAESTSFSKCSFLKTEVRSRRHCSAIAHPLGRSPTRTRPCWKTK